MTTLPIRAYAQTNLQLLNQLREAGHSESDLADVQRAYDLAVPLFSAKYRPSGKTLLAHLVGTASILASLGVPTQTVTVGLLHAAYLFGDFGFSSPSAKAKRLREQVGPDIESRLRRYHEFRWNESSIAGLSHRIADLDPVDREIVLVRLANALEDYQDLALAYCRKSEAVTALDHSVPKMARLAEDLGYPELGAQLERAASETASTHIPPSLRVDRRKTYSAAPASYRLRPTALALHAATRVWRRLKRLRGAS